MYFVRIAVPVRVKGTFFSPAVTSTSLAYFVPDPGTPTRSAAGRAAPLTRISATAASRENVICLAPWLYKCDESVAGSSTLAALMPNAKDFFKTERAAHEVSGLVEPRTK